MNKDLKIQIIGGGTFGLSTAYHFAKAGYKDVTIIDREEVPSKFSAGYDLNKIIRCEYSDEFYTSLALEAMEQWESPDFKPYFHKVGYVNCNSSAAPKKSIDTTDLFFNNLKANPKFPKDSVHYLNSESDFKDVLPLDIDFKGWTGYFNKHAGYAHAYKAMKFVSEECKNLGVKFVVDRIDRLLYSSKSECIGVMSKSSKIYSADLTILALGAHITSILPDLGKYLSPQAWSVGHIQLSEQESKPVKEMPVFNCRDIGFCFEPDEDNNIIKLCNESAGWVNYDPNSTERYSVPTESNSGVCDVDKEALRKQVDTFFPEWMHKELQDTKICWCCDRANSDFMIDFHPQYKNLFLVTADSGHAFKMLPVIGKWVLQKVEGTLPLERGERWKWFDENEARSTDDIETVSWRLGTVLNLYDKPRS